MSSEDSPNQPQPEIQPSEEPIEPIVEQSADIQNVPEQSNLPPQSIEQQPDLPMQDSLESQDPKPNDITKQSLDEHIMDEEIKQEENVGGSGEFEEIEVSVEEEIPEEEYQKMLVEWEVNNAMLSEEEKEKSVQPEKIKKTKQKKMVRKKSTKEEVVVMEDDASKKKFEFFFIYFFN